MTRSLSSVTDTWLCFMRLSKVGQALCIAAISWNRISTETQICLTISMRENATYTFPWPYEQHDHHSTTRCRTNRKRELFQKWAKTADWVSIQSLTHCLNCFITSHSCKKRCPRNLLNFFQHFLVRFASFPCGNSECLFENKLREPFTSAVSHTGSYHTDAIYSEWWAIVEGVIRICVCIKHR